ncbi:MAG: SDR family oxidoreductase [Halioglobus sp.]|nr:SDR family oxidoreductase [Halioglobus sp.]
MRLENMVTMVTGGGSGLGESMCRRFAEEGARVIVADIDAAAAGSVAGQINEQGGRAEAQVLDVLVNNAGIAILGSAEDATLVDWRKVNAVNLDAVFLGTRAAIRAMKDRGGSIINVSSIEGIIGEPLVAAYNASKGGVRVFTKSAALHCAANGYGIRVNSLHPGYVMTPLVENAVGGMDASEAEAFHVRVIGNIPFGRMAEPREIANGALFLASAEASYMTGAELVIDGGYTAH